MESRHIARLILALLGAASLLGGAFIVIGVPAGPESAVERSDLVSNAITSLGLLAAGLWALFTFVLFRSGVTNLEIAIESEVRPLHDLRMLMIVVSLRNTGKVMIEPGSGGCKLWVRRLPRDAPLGRPVDLDRGELVVDGFDLLAKYDKAFPYEIEPGADFREFCAIPIEPGVLLSIKSTFYLGGEEDDAYSERRLAFVE